VTKSGSNVFKGSAVGTFENDKMQNNNVTQEQFGLGTGGFLSGAPIKKIYNISGEYGGPIVKNRLWWWLAADKQSINAGVVNFFDRARPECVQYAEAQRTGSLISGGSLTYDNLETVQDCLKNDQTIIKNKQAKLNFQLNASHKFQYQFSSDNKFRNARGASADTELEAVTIQTSEFFYWSKFPLPTHQGTHTWIASDRLVFNSAITKVQGGFFLDYQDTFFGDCANSRYTGSTDPASYPQFGVLNKPGETCMFNIQRQQINTTGNLSRSLAASYQTVRPSLEIKTDGTYFLSNVLGGDHSLKFGAGYRRNPITSFSHESGGGRAIVNCVGNNSLNCGDGRTYVAPGSPTGLVPRAAQLTRDSVLNNDWWSYNGYIQDSYSYKRLRVNAGLRYDWQQSKWKGGCVMANPIRPDLMPSQCDEATMSGVSPVTGQVEEIRPFHQFSPRMSLTYDLFGNGKTALKATGSYYYSTKITLANSLSGLFNTASLTWGNNQNSGACSTAANSTCWTDANRNGFIEANELIGTPTQNGFVNGQFLAAGNAVLDSAKLGRTREVTAGISHELISNLAVGADFIYRKYDRGTQTYNLGYEPGAPGYPVSSIYSTTPSVHLDTVTGKTANYFLVQTGLTRPSSLTVTATNPDYQDYKGVDLTLQKRYSDKWQFNAAVTLQKRNDTDVFFLNPTGVDLTQGLNTQSRYLIKLNGSYDLPWGVMFSTNFNWNDGAIRTLTISGPGQVYGGTSGTINYATLRFEPADATRLKSTKLWDVGINKTFTFRGGQNRIKATIDGFNILNQATVLGYGSDNLTSTNSVRINSILPPRVFRAGLTVWF
jgi:hypothetical protein